MNCRKQKRKSLILLFALCLCASVAKAQTLVQITDTPKNADGTLAAGRLVVSWTQFTTAAGVTIDGGTLAYLMLASPAAPSVSQVGTPGATTYYYWVSARSGGSESLLSSGTLTATSNAALSATNYNAVSWEAVPGAADYRVWRTTSSTAPTGTGSFLVGVATATTLNDQSNTLTSATIPANTVNLSLTPNVGALPTGTSYQAQYFLTNGASYIETWVIPETGPVTIAQVRTLTIPVPVPTVNVSQVIGGGANKCAQYTAGGVLSSALGGCGGSLTVEEVDGAPSVATSTLRFDQADGFALTDVGGGVARVDLTLPSSGHTIQEESASLPARAKLNFVGPAITATDDAVNDQSDVTVLIDDSTVPNNITLDNLTQITTRAIGDTSGDLAASRVDDGGVAATQALFSGAGAAAGFRAIADGDIPAAIARDSELHAQVHTLADTTGLGADHTTSGLTAGQVLRASGATTAAFAAIQDGDLPATIARDSEINVQGTANEIASSGSGVAPTLSLASQLNLSAKEILGGATPLRFEGTTDNNFYWQLTLTDPTATRTTTVPNADTVFPQGYSCTNQVATALSGSTGGTTCTTITSAYTSGTFAATAHNLLSATHGDTATASPVLGDILSGNSTPAWARVAGNITTTKQFLSQTGTGAVSAAPVWAQPAFADLSGSATAGQVPNLESLNGTLDVPSGGTGAAPGAGDQLLVSDSTSAATWRAVPTCNTVTEKTFYNTATNTWTCEADAGAGGGAPVSAQYVVGATDATLTAEKLLTDGVGIDTVIAGGDGGSATIALDFADAGADPALGAGGAKFSNEGASAAGLVFEGDTEDGFETRVRVTDPTVADRIVIIPNADSTTVQPDTGAANNFLTAISSVGVISKAQPAFSNLSGTFSDAQVPATLDLNNNVLQGANPLVLEGMTVDAFDTTVAVTDPTAARTFTIPNADSAAVQPLTCSGTDKVSAVSGLGVITCTADQGGTGGDSMEVEDGDNGGTFTAIVTTGRFEDSGDINFVNTANDISGLVRANAVALTDDTTGNYVATITAGAGLTGDATTEGSTPTLATASGEANFLASGALVCGAATQGKAQVHTTPLQYCDNAATPALQYAAYGNSSGQATVALDLSGTNVIGATEIADLDVASGGTGAATLTGLLQGNGTSAITGIANSSTVGQTLRVTGVSTYAWGALDLADADAITGDIPDANLSATVSLLGQTIEGSEMTSATVTSTQLATANKTLTKSITILDPTTAETNQAQWYWPAAVTLNRIACSVDAGTSVTINFDERAEATPNTAGTNTLSAGLVCDTNTQTSCAAGCDVNTISDSGIAADVPHNLQITAVSGTVGAVRIHLRGTIN